MISHNLSVSAKTSLINNINEDIYTHNLYGFDLNIISKDDYQFIFLVMKKSSILSSNTEGAKGLYGSLNFIFELTMSFISARDGFAIILLFPKDLGPHSILF